MEFRRFLAVCFVLFISFASFTASKVFAEPAIFFSTPPKFIEAGDRVTIDIRVRADEAPINAVSGVASFPSDLLQLVSVSRDRSIINIWTEEPRMQRGKIVFEGVIMNPGFQGSSGLVLRATFEAKKTGTASLAITEGAVLANDGLGTNLLASLLSTNFKIVAPKPIFTEKPPIATVPPQEPEVEYVLPEGKRLVALPVITEYPSLVTSKDRIEIKGKGEPNALTKLVFKDVSSKSLGERFISAIQRKKTKLDEALVQNNEEGAFEYVSGENITAGVYNATPFLVDTERAVEKPGFGVQLLVNDSKVVRYLVVAINVLALLIPVVGLVVIIYFIPWYSWRRMRVIKKRLLLEEEKLSSSGHQIERQERILDKTVDQMVVPKPSIPKTESPENGIILPKE